MWMFIKNLHWEYCMTDPFSFDWPSKFEICSKGPGSSIVQPFSTFCCSNVPTYLLWYKLAWFLVLFCFLQLLLCPGAIVLSISNAPNNLWNQQRYRTSISACVFSSACYTSYSIHQINHEGSEPRVFTAQLLLEALMRLLSSIISFFR